MSLWLYNFQKILPTDIVYHIVNYAGSPLPYPKFVKMMILHRHFQKHYCKTCGEYMSNNNRHRHFSRQKIFRYCPKYERNLHVHEMLYISKTNYRLTKHTPYDMIVVWQNTLAYYCSFRKCINMDRSCKIQSYRDVYFTDIGISSSASFWYVDQWNVVYPDMQYDDRFHRFEFRTNNFLWTPKLNPI